MLSDFSSLSLLSNPIKLLRLIIVTQETIGSYTSTDMQNAGASDKDAAVEEIRAAKQASDQQGGEVNKNETLGKVEQTMGSVTGCEGMEEEGAKRQA